MPFLREGRLCLAPIQPHTCHFHSNVSSGFYCQTRATVTPTSHMRAGHPALPLMTITKPYHDCTNMKMTFESIQITLFSEKWQMLAEVAEVTRP